MTDIIKISDNEELLNISSSLKVKLLTYHNNNPNTELGNYVFINRLKKPYSDQSVDKHIREIRDFIYENYGIDMRFVSAHYFRHTYVTVGLNSGVKIHDMQRLVGHKKPETTMRYFHEDKAIQQQAATKISEIVMSKHDTYDSTIKIVNDQSNG